MEVLRNLFEGYPNLWGGGVAHSVLILSLTIAFGIILAKIKVRGVSLGVTWILFVGIVFGHFNMNLDEHLLHFLKEFGLILFVYSIGLQVGPGFFSAFKKGGFTLNMLAMLVVVLGVTITIILHFTTGTPITTMVGILSGAVTNTPGLGAAQQANSDLNGIDAPEIALGYAVSYPLGVVGIILSLLALKYLLRINTAQEEKEAEVGLGHLQELTVRPISIEVRNESVDGIRIKELRPLLNRKFVISRIKHREGGETELVNSETILHVGDIILVISTPIDVEAITIFFGKEIKMAEQHPINGLMGTSMEKIRELVDVNTIIGDPITSPDGTIIIPVSKVSFGFVAGGSDLPTKAPKEVFAGGSGAGITINPQAFIVVQRDGDVKMLELGATGNSAIDGIISGVPDLISKIKAIFSKDDEESEEKTEE